MPPQIMPLSEITRLLKVNKSKLAYYFKLGLLIPTSSFPETKLFLFDLVEVKRRLKQINDLQERGYKLTEMGPKLK
jgi:DNA-binding transcriptional MerR regulator